MASRAVELVAHLWRPSPAATRGSSSGCAAPRARCASAGRPPRRARTSTRALGGAAACTDRPAVLWSWARRSFTASGRTPRSTICARRWTAPLDPQVRAEAALDSRSACAMERAAFGRRSRSARPASSRRCGEDDEEAAMQLDGLLGCSAQLGRRDLEAGRRARLARYERPPARRERRRADAAGRRGLRCRAPAGSAAQPPSSPSCAIADGRLLGAYEHATHAPNFFARRLDAGRGRPARRGRALTAGDRARARARIAARLRDRGGLPLPGSLPAGAIAEAEAEARSCLERSAAGARRPMLIACVLDAMVERADFDGCAALLAERRHRGGPLGVTMASRLLYSRGHMRLAAGDPAGALRDFEQIRGREERWGLDTRRVPTRASAALAHAQLGDHERARRSRPTSWRARRLGHAEHAVVRAARGRVVAGGDEGSSCCARPPPPARARRRAMSSRAR